MQIMRPPTHRKTGMAPTWREKTAHIQKNTPIGEIPPPPLPHGFFYLCSTHWVPLSKKRENARLILFYKIINNLAMVPHSCLEKADGRTRKNHNLKFRHIGYNVDPYGQSFFPKCISAWNGLAQEIAEANTLDLFKSKLAH